jgi:hypothetical protein
MNKIFVLGLAVAAVIGFFPAGQAEANTNYYAPTSYQYQPTSVSWGSNQMNEEQMIAFLKQLIAQLQAQINAKKGSSYTGGVYYNPGSYGYGYVIGEPRGSGSSRNDDDEPEVETDSAKDVSHDEAELRGSVDMMDFEDGEVFFVFGQDEDQVEEVEDDYESYGDIDEDDEDLMKVRVDSSLDGDEDYEEVVNGLEEDTEYYFQICVGYEDEDDDEVIVCGGVDDFTTDENN